jgi:Flp pilus assembly protein TadB
MDERYWLPVLMAMYRRSPPEDDYICPMRFVEHITPTWLEQETDLSEAEVKQAREELAHRGLLREEDLSEYYEDSDDHDSNYMYFLTQQGFEVAHDWTISKRQNRTNEALVIFTLFLVLVEIISIAGLGRNITIALLLIILLALLYLVERTQILSLRDIRG